MLEKALGRIYVGGADTGAGFVVGPRDLVTAYHVVRDAGDRPLEFVSKAGELRKLVVCRAAPDVDAALLAPADGEFPDAVDVVAAIEGWTWHQVTPGPLPGDPVLTGTVTSARIKTKLEITDDVPLPRRRAASAR